MPARRQQRARRDRAAKATSEFDIPEDSSDAQDKEAEEVLEGGEAEESYVASPRTRNGKRQGQGKLQKNRKPPSKIQKQAENGGRHSKSRKASTQSPSFTGATPSSAAKKSQQQNHTKTDHHAKIHSWHANKNGIESVEAEAGSEDKENRPSSSSAASSKRGVGNRSAAGEPLSSDDDIEIEVGRGRVKGDSGDTQDEYRVEQARLAKKFKEVDEWEMEFEDVTFSEGSDPLAR
jgi:hypothetical protein